MLKSVSKFLKAVSSNTNPNEIAHAFACGILLGFMPKNNLLWYILFFLFFFLRIQRSVLTLTLIISTLVAPLMDPLFNIIGEWILTRPFLISFYQWLLNIPFVSFTKFNNTILMGSFVSGVILYLPCFGLSRLFIYLWRRFCAQWFNKLKLVQVIKKLSIAEKFTDLPEVL